jgi:hypothetical protein
MVVVVVKMMVMVEIVTLLCTSGHRLKIVFILLVDFPVVISLSSFS